MAFRWLLSLAAAIEAATGFALMTFPGAVSTLLLGADVAGTGIAVARVAGAALLSLGLVCWMSRKESGKAAALPAMLTYNLLVTAYLTHLGIGGELVGVLLWPAIAVHAVLTLLFAYVWFDDQRPKLAAR
jgi:predicted membrane-bound spermidine synthase